MIFVRPRLHQLYGAVSDTRIAGQSDERHEEPRGLAVRPDKDGKDGIDRPGPITSLQRPDQISLPRILQRLLGGGERDAVGLTVLEREPNPYTSTYWSGVVTCQFIGGSTVQLQCKYNYGRAGESYGHRGAVPYEAQVCQNVLQSAVVPTPKSHGAHSVANCDEVTLYLQATTTAVSAPCGQTPVVRVHPNRDKVSFYGTLNLDTGQ